LFAHRPFVLGLAVTLLFYAGNASFYFVLALYLQQGLLLSPLASGAVFTVLAAGFFATSMAAPALARRFGRQAILLGALVLAAGHALVWGLLALVPAPSLALLLPAMALQGCGLGMVMAPLVSTVLAGLPQQHAGVASGVLATVQQAGNALGVALVGLVFYGLSSGAGAAAVKSGFAAALLYLLALALGVALLYRRFLRAAG
jgi:MFS family permease